MDLLVEVAVGEHPGRLDGVAQLHLAPGTAHLGRAQRGREPRRLGADLLARLGERLHGGAERAVVLAAGALELLDALAHAGERLAQRLHQLLNRLFLLAEPAGRELEERLRVLAQRVGGEGVEAVCEAPLGVLEQRDLLLGTGALVLQLGSKGGALAGAAGADDEPRGRRSEGDAEQECEQEGHGPTNDNPAVGRIPRRGRGAGTKKPAPTNP